ncbi:MAG: D-alanine-D-alanine ligase [Luteibaculaceae bacterium]|jgi:D-alanine-D-alanine ligase
MMPLIALFAGGYSSEREISLESANNVFEAIEKKCEIIFIDLQKDQWIDHITGEKIQMDCPSGTIISGQQKRRPDYAVIMIHGLPGENGWLQGLLEMCHIPYSSGGPLNLGVTFDKGMTIAFLEKFGFPTAKSQVIYADRPFSLRIKFPLFCKPCEAGSSFGISLVEQEEDLQKAIQFAEKESRKILLEEKMVGREISCGVYRKIEGEIQVLRGTEITTDEPFFNYEAKYLGKSLEITPAPLTEGEYTDLESLCMEVYDSLQCKGIVRIDFILNAEHGFRIIEVNSIPGFTKESIVPQQLRDLFIPFSDVFALPI